MSDNVTEYQEMKDLIEVYQFCKTRLKVLDRHLKHWNDKGLSDEHDTLKEFFYLVNEGIGDLTDIERLVVTEKMETDFPIHLIANHLHYSTPHVSRKYNSAMRKLLRLFAGTKMISEVSTYMRKK